MTGSQLMQSLQNLSVSLTDDYVQFGAYMQPNASYTGGTINIGVSQLDGHIMQFGGDEYLGRNYVLFHELGHGVSLGLSYVQNGGSSPEAFANTMGYSLAGFAGEAYPAALSDVGSSGWWPF